MVELSSVEAGSLITVSKLPTIQKEVVTMGHVNGGAFRVISELEWHKLGGDSNELCDWHEGIGHVIYDDQALEEFKAKRDKIEKEHSMGVVREIGNNTDTKRSSLLSSNATLQDRVEVLLNAITGARSRFLNDVPETASDDANDRVSDGSIHDMIDANDLLITKVNHAIADVDAIVNSIGER